MMKKCIYFIQQIISFLVNTPKDMNIYLFHGLFAFLIIIQFIMLSSTWSTFQLLTVLIFSFKWGQIWIPVGIFFICSVCGGGVFLSCQLVWLTGELEDRLWQICLIFSGWSHSAQYCLLLVNQNIIQNENYRHKYMVCYDVSSFVFELFFLRFLLYVMVSRRQNWVKLRLTNIHSSWKLLYWPAIQFLYLSSSPV